jgi:hypothetical protein
MIKNQFFCRPNTGLCWAARLLLFGLWLLPKSSALPRSGFERLPYGRFLKKHKRP